MLSLIAALARNRGIGKNQASLANKLNVHPDLMQ